MKLIPALSHSAAGTDLPSAQDSVGEVSPLLCVLRKIALNTVSQSKNGPECTLQQVATVGGDFLSSKCHNPCVLLDVFLKIYINICLG